MLAAESATLIDQPEPMPEPQSTVITDLVVSAARLTKSVGCEDGAETRDSPELFTIGSCPVIVVEVELPEGVTIPPAIFTLKYVLGAKSKSDASFEIRSE